MLKKILELLEERGAVSLKDLESNLDVQASAIEEMLNVLIRKGRVRELTAEEFSASCPSNKGGGCKSCPVSKDENNYRFFALTDK